MKPKQLEEMFKDNSKKQEIAQIDRESSPRALRKQQTKQLRFDAGYDDYLPQKNKILRFAEELVMQVAERPALQLDFDHEEFKHQHEVLIITFRKKYIKLRDEILKNQKKELKKAN